MNWSVLQNFLIAIILFVLTGYGLRQTRQVEIAIARETNHPLRRSDNVYFQFPIFFGIVLVALVSGMSLTLVTFSPQIAPQRIEVQPRKELFPTGLPPTSLPNYFVPSPTPGLPTPTRVPLDIIIKPSMEFTPMPTPVITPTLTPTPMATAIIMPTQDAPQKDSAPVIHPTGAPQPTAQPIAPTSIAPQPTRAPIATSAPPPTAKPIAPTHVPPTIQPILPTSAPPPTSVPRPTAPPPAPTVAPKPTLGSVIILGAGVPAP